MLCPRGQSKDGHQVAAFMASMKVCKDWDVCTCADGCLHSRLQLATVAPVAFVPLSPKLFGRSIWSLLHACARYCPGRVHDILVAMEHVLPCMRCREHLIGRRTDAHGLSAGQIAQAVGRKVTAEEAYMFNLHNDVNEISGKPEAPPGVLNGQNVDIPLALKMIRGQWAYEVPSAMCSRRPASAPDMVSMLKSKVCYEVVETVAADVEAAMRACASEPAKRHDSSAAVVRLCDSFLLWNL